jgi:ATP-dependent Lon protease
MVVPLFVGREKSIRAIQSIDEDKKEILLFTQKDPSVTQPKTDNLFHVGTLGHVLQVLTLPDGTVKALIEGKMRVQATQFLSSENFFQATAEPVPETMDSNETLEALRRALLKDFESYIKLTRSNLSDILSSISQIEDMSKMVYTISAQVQLKNLNLKQKLLETNSLEARTELLLGYIGTEIELLQTEKRIRNRLKTKVERDHREYILQEQMRAIQKELGDTDDSRDEVSELEAQIKQAKLPQEAHAKAMSELKKLKNMSLMSAEATVIRNYLDWILCLPWDTYTRSKIKLSKAQKVLDEEHYGLEKIKERILEYLAVQSRVDKAPGFILCLVGPPGVGKTSLGKSIARATGRKFIRISLGGVQDEAEIRGHRRTYIGSLPGKIIQALKKVEVSDPVILIDEVEKLSSNFRGDPASALLEVLDPEQNKDFTDHYLELGYDLSRVMFIATANSMNMHPALLDRMEVVRIAGYTPQEKLEIAKQHLIPHQLKMAGLSSKELTISDGALTSLINDYCREAGVRNLERFISKIARKAVRAIDSKQVKHLHVTKSNLKKYAGIPRYRFESASTHDLVGVTTGLAWTEVGGELLKIEAVMLPGKGKIMTTGKLGEVMQESIQAASSFVRSQAIAYGIKPTIFEKRDIHVHVPEGATPKDGPSAGVAMCASIVSVLTGIPIKSAVAMTGEISLRGRVLPIGGLKEKLLAAHRGHIKTVLIPEENKRDLEEVPENILRALEVIPVSTVGDILNHALVTQPEALSWSEREDVLTNVSNAKKSAENPLLTH